MESLTLLFVLAIGGVNFGWQPVGDGKSGYEYTVQVEPELVDAMQRGESIPIESNIPPEVTPVRKVRVVVGRDQLPRVPQRHTANFAGQPGWTPDRYPAATATSDADRYSSPAPSLMNRTQTAITETGSALSDGVQAGMRSTQEQFSRVGGQVMSDSQNAAQQFGQQLQQYTDATGRQIQSAGNNVQTAAEQTFSATGDQIRQAGNSIGLTNNAATTSAGGVSAPPWPQSTAASSAQTVPYNASAAGNGTFNTMAPPPMAPSRTANGWTTIGNNVAPPPLMNPPLTDPANNSAGIRVAQGGSSGPNLAAPSGSASREPYHSVLVDPSQQGAGASNTSGDWGNPWGTSAAAAAPATIGRNGDAARPANSGNNTGLVPVQPQYPNQQNTQQAADRWSDSWANDPWIKQQQSGAPPQTVGSPPSTGQAVANGGWPTNGANSAVIGTHAGSGQAAIGPPPNSTTAAYPANSTAAGGAPQANNSFGHSVAGGNPGAKQVLPTTETPWMPLVLTALSLIGSLSANVYLGMSYLGARQKYVSLVQRTADTFRRATGTAAA